MIFFSLSGKELTTQEKLEFVTHQRNTLLTSCDWTQLEDAILSNSEKVIWENYRQALRDIPQNFINPDDVVFPTPPTYLSDWVQL